MQLPAIAVSQSPEAKFREYLASRPRPQRYTDQQREMLNYIFSQHDHFDADQLCDDMRRKKNIRVSRATVYRTLNKLVEAGLFRCLETGPRKFYEHDYGYPQHEHMQCQVCNEMIEFESPAITSLMEEVCRKHGFQASGHTLVIRGTCTKCNKARVTKRKLDLI